MINETLRLIRVYHDMKQYEAAERLGISKSYLSEIEKGKKTPSIELLNRYAGEFNLPVSSIMFFSEQLPTSKLGKRAQFYFAKKVITLLRLIENQANAETNHK